MSEIQDLTAELRKLVNLFVAGGRGGTAAAASRIVPSRGSFRSSDDDDDDAETRRSKESIKKRSKELEKKLSLAAGALDNARLVEAAYANLARQLKSAGDTTGATNDDLKELHELLGDFQGEMRGSLRNMELGADEAGTAFWKFARNINGSNDASKMFNSSFAKSIASASALSTALLDNSKSIEEGTELFDELTKGVKGSWSKLNTSLLRAGGIYDELTGTINSNLSARQMSLFNLRVGGAAAAIEDARAGIEGMAAGLSLESLTDVNAVADLLKSDSQAAIGSLKNLDNQLNSFGVSFDHIWTNLHDQIKTISENSALSDEDKDTATRDAEAAAYSQFVKEVIELQGQASESLREFSSTAQIAGNELGVLGFKITHATASIKDWTDANILSAQAIESNIGNFKSAMGTLIDEMQGFNIAMIPESFASVAAKAVEMGMSFDETMKYLQDNKRMYAIHGGAEGFERANDAIMDTYKKEGFTQKQAATLRADHTDLAAVSGVNIRDTDQLTRFISQTTQNFKELSAVVGMTAEEYNTEMLAIAESNEMMAASIGLDSERAQALAQSNAEQFKNYRLLGLSNEEAREALLAGARRNRSALSEKYGDAARAAMLAQQSGASQEDVNTIQTLGMKSYLNEDERAKYEAALQRAGAAAEKRSVELGESGDQQGHAMFGALRSALMGGMSSDAQASMERGVKIDHAMRSGKAVTREEAEKMVDAAAPDTQATEAFDWVNSISALMQSAFVGALTAGIAALVGLTVSALKAASALRMIGGGGGGGIMDTIGDVLGRRRGRPPRAGRGARARPASGPGSVEDGQRRVDARRAARAAPTPPGATGPRGLSPTDRSAAATARTAATTARESNIAARVLNPKNLLKGAGVGAVIGIGGGLAVDALASSGMINEEQEQMANAGMDIAGWAGMGATIGSVVPVVGTAIGGAIGGLAGTAMNWNEGGKDLVQGLAKWTPMGMMARVGEHTAGVTDSIFGTNTQESLAGINESIFGSRFTDPKTDAASPSQQNSSSSSSSQDQSATESAVNRNDLTALGPDGTNPLQTLIASLSPEKLSESLATALNGVRLTLYNPSSATTSHAYITGRQTA